MDGGSIHESRKRSRTIMTVGQNRTLMQYFEVNRFPSAEVREELSKILNMKPRTIQIWFQNQRQKTRNRSGAKIHDSNVKDKNGYAILEKHFKKLYVLASVAICEIRKREREVRLKSDKQD